MAATSKSPRRILTVGYLIGKLALPNYAHKFSPKTYTQPQLFACLVLKEFLHRDYRGVEALLRDTPELAAAIELKHVPDHSTLHKAAKRRLRAELAGRLLDMTVRLAQGVGKLPYSIPLAALDGTGLESHHASAYYVRRKAKGQDFKRSMTYRRFPKAGLVCDCKSHFILSIVPERGPGPELHALPSSLRSGVIARVGGKRCQTNPPLGLVRSRSRRANSYSAQNRPAHQ